MISAGEALTKLREGNQRFISGAQGKGLKESQERRAELVEGQNPFAIILGCSDSRVPTELIFDQGLGDLFVIRVAGNVVAPSLIGSVEYAASQFGTPLVVVLGHSNCGAVSATLQELETEEENRSPNLRSIVERIRPSVETLMETELRHDRNALVDQSVRANVRASVSQLRTSSQILEDLIQAGGLHIVGAEYYLETGEVDFFTGLGNLK